MDENELRELWRQATPGPMIIGYHECASIDEMADSLKMSLKLREGEPQALTLWFVFQEQPDPPYEHGVNTCVTGNGPNARNNAVFYAHCHDAIPLLLDEVKRLRGEMTELHTELNAALRRLGDAVARYRPDWEQVPELQTLAGQVERILDEEHKKGHLDYLSQAFNEGDGGYRP